MVMRRAGQGPVRGAGLAPDAHGPMERGSRERRESGISQGGRGRLRILWIAMIAAVAMAGAADRVGAQSGGPGEGELGVEATENLVRQIHFEGLPEAEVARIGAAGAARLIEMLADPAETPSHARILYALGLIGGPDAYDAIAAWVASQPTAGEIDRDRFRAWQALPFALGRLASRDPRALRDLEACFAADPPGWTFRHFGGSRLQALERRAAAGALAETGLPEAQRILDGVERDAADPALVGHVRALRAEAARRAAGGPR